MFGNNYGDDFFNLVELPALRAVMRSVQDPASFFSTQSLKRSFKYPYDIIFHYQDSEHENVESIEIRIALAGFKKEDIKIKSDANVLTIDIDPCDSQMDDKVVYRTKGISLGKESISFTILDKCINIENLKCKMEDGILDIVIPYQTIDNSKIYSIE